VTRKRSSVEQIVAVLKQAEMGTSASDLIRPTSGLPSRRSTGESRATDC